MKCMYSFKELRKASKLGMSGKELRLAVLGNCSTQFFSVAVRGYAGLEKLNVNVFDADYNQIDMQLLDKGSEVYRFQPDCILLWFASDKLYEEFLDLSLSERNGFADAYMQKLEYYWDLVGKNSNARILQMNFTEIDDKALGQYSAKVDSTFIYQIRKLNWLLQEAMSRNSNLYPVDLLAVQVQLGESEFYDAPLYYNAKMSVSTKALPYIAKAVTDVLKSMSGRSKKCIILDLDNTLWGGVIGDDGINNIEIGELGRGRVFSNLQRWLKQLKELGIILAVCSKNDEDIAKEPFEKHEEMVLHLNDISVFAASWNDKVSNIRMIQESLNIGFDSMVFVDDNPFERNLVRQKLPEVEVPELPEDPAHYLEYLQCCNYFDVVSFSAEAADRTGQYQAEFERKRSEASFTSIEDYLTSLEMVGTGRAFEKSRYSRIAQLTQRSNQFNLRTIRYTEDEIRRIAESNEYLTLYYTLRDRFGDHGLIGVIIAQKVNKDELFVDTWLMSCRVLKRGMEEFMINKLAEKAALEGFTRISAEYIPTAKNKMVKDIYRDMGFRETSENQYSMELNDYRMKHIYIKEEP